MKKRLKILLASFFLFNNIFVCNNYAAENNYSTKEIKPIDLHLDTNTKTITKEKNVQDNNNLKNNASISFIIDTSKIPKGIYTIQGITEIDSLNKITYKESINIKSNNFEITSNKLLGTEETKPNKIYNVNMQLLNKENKVVLNKDLKCQREKLKEDVEKDKSDEKFINTILYTLLTIAIVYVAFYALLFCMCSFY